MRFRSAAGSHSGLVRDNNEDRVYTDDERGFFMVVDGMGGHAAGEVAADIAIKSIRSRLERQTDSVERRIREAIALANNAIHEAAQNNPEWNGMACVLTVAVIAGRQATIGHVGDSRLYKFRQGRMEKITRDHSPVGEREDSGELNEEQAMSHPRRNEVYRDVGSEEHSPEDGGFIEISTVPFEPDSALLLCSDGLSDVLPSADILRIVQAHAADPPVAVRELIEAANRNSKDNVSAVLVEGEAFAKVAAKPESRSPWLYLAAGVLLGALLTFAALRYFEPPAAHSRTIVVRPQESIAAALRDAAPGDVIHLAAGEYAETVHLKNGVDVAAEREHEAKITGGIVAEGVGRARVTGFKISGGDIGIRIKDSNIAIERDEVTGTRIAAIEFSGTSNGVVEASSIHDNAGAAIVVRDLAAPLLIGNTIIENKRRERSR
ncbi:MAG: protein phosphatase 2C domain-containing protein [Acidobacteriota bacterium]|nr:protein phosphatase 2C domain-containing protein [Acidobacteriota bacterium]